MRRMLMQRPPLNPGGIFRLLCAALVLSVIVAAGTAGAIIFFMSTVPESESGRFWAIWVPAGICGMAAFVVAILRFYSGTSITALWQSIKDAWDAFGRMYF